MPRQAVSKGYAARGRMAGARNVLRKAMQRRYKSRAWASTPLRKVMAGMRTRSMKRPVRTAAWSAVKRRVYRKRASTRGY